MGVTTMNWDDLRVLLAIARHTTLSGAAKALGVNHSTVSRRLATLEDNMGVRLFERLQTGYEPTAAGRDVLGSARRVEDEINALDRRVLGKDQRLSGAVRLTTVDLLAVRFTEVFGEFAQRYPNVELTVSVDNTPRNLNKREADVALRLTVDSPPDNLVGRRLANVAFALYGARSLLLDHGRAPVEGQVDIDGLPWMAWDDRVGARLTHAWMKEHVPQARITARLDCTLVMVEAIRAGLGIGFMTCFDGEGDPNLVRLQPPVREFGMQLWLLTHPDLKSTARVKALTDHIGESTRSLADRFGVPHLIDAA